MKTNKYADVIGAEFYLDEYNDKFRDYVTYFKRHYPFITMYNIVNFYKLELMDHYLHHHEEVLYLDFDAMPVTNISLDTGICQKELLLQTTMIKLDKHTNL